MKTEVLAYYTAHGPLTDPGPYAGLLDVLPHGLAELHAAIDGLLIHVWRVQKYLPHLLETRAGEVFIRHTSRLLEAICRLNGRPLNVARPPEQRLIIDCRHFAVLLCAVLRHRGVPARARCGFATYLEDDYYMDHWACEYWNPGAGRWVLEDADKGLHDVAPEQFITGTCAWQMARAGVAPADLFGFGPDMRGDWVLRTNLVRDFAALNGFESVSGDEWGLALEQALRQGGNLAAEDLALLDRAGELAVSDDAFAARRWLYETSSGLRVPPVIHNYDWVVAQAWRAVEWAKEP